MMDAEKIVDHQLKSETKLSANLNDSRQSQFDEQSESDQDASNEQNKTGPFKTSSVEKDDSVSCYQG